MNLYELSVRFPVSIIKFDTREHSLWSLLTSAAGLLAISLSSWFYTRFFKPKKANTLTNVQTESIQKKMRLIRSRASRNDIKEREINGLVILSAYMGYEKDILELRDAPDWKAYYAQNSNLEEATTVFQALVEKSELHIPIENQSIYGLIPMEKVPLMNTLVKYRYKGEEKVAVFKRIFDINLP